jgi:hypothetical protein
VAEDKGGRPRIIETPEEFEAKAGEYFAELDRANLERFKEGGGQRPPTIAGLALHLGFASRQSFYDYENEAGFSYSVRKTRLRIEQHHEERMSGNSPTGSIFWLKNHDWSDRQELEHTGRGGGPIEYRDMTDEEVQERAKQLRNRLLATGTSTNGKH